jgi:hypothetical protein
MISPLYGSLSALGQSFAKAAAALSSLLNDLVSYWPLDELSGVRYDFVGYPAGNNLIDNNTVGAVLRGPTGTVANFIRSSSESLSKSGVALPASYTVAGWYKVSVAADCAFFTCYSAWPNSVQGYVGYASNDSLNTVIGDGAAYTQTWIGPLVHDEWYFMCVTYDAVTKTMTLSKNNVDGSPSAALSGTRYAGPSTFVLGDGSDTGWFPLTGNLGRVGLWDHVFTSGERASLFNSGNGKSYSDLTTEDKVGLISYWNLDEVGGTRYDSHGTNHLTDNNTVGSVNRGPAGTVANFVATNSESLSKASFVMPGSYMVAGWLKFHNNGAPYFNCSLDYANNIQTTLWLSNPNTLAHIVGDGASSAYAGCFTPGAPSLVNDGLWHFVEAWFDGSDKTPHIRVDRGTADNWVPGTPLAGTPYRTAQPLAVGGGTGGFQFFDGAVGRLGLWSAVDQDILASLFNSGSGKSYADLTAAEKVGLVSYWDLDEVSGTRYDSHGTNHLTDNNTVGSAVNAGGAMDGAAANFVAASNEKLSAGSVTPAAPWAMAGWFYIPSTVRAYATLLDGGDSGADPGHWGLYAKAPSLVTTLQLLARNGAGDSLTGSGVVPDSWNFVYIEFSPTPSISVNNGTMVTGVGGATTDTIFNIGKSGPGDYFDGRADELAVWSRVLTADERAELFAAGAGKFYPFE